MYHPFAWGFPDSSKIATPNPGEPCQPQSLRMTSECPRSRRASCCYVLLLAMATRIDPFHGWCARKSMDSVTEMEDCLSHCCAPFAFLGFRASMQLQTVCCDADLTPLSTGCRLPLHLAVALFPRKHIPGPARLHKCQRQPVLKLRSSRQALSLGKIPAFIQQCDSQSFC